MTDWRDQRPIHGGNLAWAAQVAGCAPDSLLDFSASISPLGPPPGVLKAIQEAMGDLGHYPDPSYSALRAALAAHHGVAAEQVLPGNGAAELLTWAGQALAATGPTVLLTPAFSDYGRALGAAGGNTVAFPLLQNGRWRDPAAVLPELLVWLRSQPPSQRPYSLLLNNPHNPSGYLLPRSGLEPLLDLLELVVVDEAFMDFLPPDRQQSAVEWLAQRQNLVVLRSQTKLYRLPGLRLGYALGDPRRLRRWQQRRDPWPVNTLAAAAAAQAPLETSFHQRTWCWLEEAAPQLYQGLQRIPALSPLAGAVNFFLVHSRCPVPQLQHNLLKQHRILIRDCLSFPELGEAYFRVAVRTPEDNQRLLQALAQATAALA